MIKALYSEITGSISFVFVSFALICCDFLLFVVGFIVIWDHLCELLAVCDSLESQVYYVLLILG